MYCMWTKMSRQWMYMADRRSKEFMDGVHEFIEAAEKHKYGGFVRCPCQFCKNEKDYSSTERFTITCSATVSCPTTMFGPSMEKVGLFWRMVKKKMILFLTLSTITTMPALKTLQWVSLKKMLKDTL